VESNAGRAVPVKNTDLDITLKAPNNTGSFLELGYRPLGNHDFR